MSVLSLLLNLLWIAFGGLYMEAGRVLAAVDLRSLDERQERQKIERDFEKLRRQQTGRKGLLQFVRYFWHSLEPKTGWPLEAICDHPEALTFGKQKVVVHQAISGREKAL
jgi:hypothetical protein